jgi:hypothetical protein
MTETMAIVVSETTNLRAGDFDQRTDLDIVQSEILWDDVVHDLTRIAKQVAQTYQDVTCYALHADNLEAGVMARISKAMYGPANYAKRLPSTALTRRNFFKIIKTIANNYARAEVQSHRFTEKRTGQKPPTKQDVKEKNDAYWEHVKRVDVSLDDIEANVQISDAHARGPLDALLEDELHAGVRATLLPVELLVFNQTLEPNADAHARALLDAERGRKEGEPRAIKLKIEHLAAGLGLTREAYVKVETAMRGKVLQYINMTKNPEQDEVAARALAAIEELEEIYSVQIPPSTDKLIVRRLLTLVARERFEILTPHVAKLLTDAGAVVPQLRTDLNELVCYGALYSATHRACQGCALRAACQVDAANVGLGEVSLAPELVTRQSRTPTLSTATAASVTRHDDVPDGDSTGAGVNVPAPAPGRAVASAKRAAPSTTRVTPAGLTHSEEVMTYLTENFKRQVIKGETYFRHKVKLPDNRNVFPFLVTNIGDQISVRLCGASDVLKSALVKVGQGYYLNPGATAVELIALIDRHADITFHG